MDLANFTHQFSQIGTVILYCLTGVSCAAGVTGFVNLVNSKPFAPKISKYLFIAANVLFLAGFFLTCWFHFKIYQQLPLLLPDNLAGWINKQLAAMNSQAAYTFALYDPDNPPRYAIPLWIENEKYYFWFMCYSIMAYFAFLRIDNHRIKGTLLVFLCAQVAILFIYVNPFAEPLPKFFAEITPWHSGKLSAMQLFGQFMKLYPRMIFYYNASYMWLHPPMLFLSYCSITVTFITSVFMLIRREHEIEVLGYDYAKFGYFMLTLGMLLGYPWALKAWGPNWWWDPKICSSIMMWAIYSTYLHTRLYANKLSMWYFTSILGILCFLAMLFTFVSSFFFPGEHTFQ